MDLHQVILEPIITEKSNFLREEHKGLLRYSFYIHRDANKELVRQAVHYFYKAKTAKVNIMITPGKPKRYRRDKFKQPGLKKAIVTLQRGHAINLMGQEK